MHLHDTKTPYTKIVQINHGLSKQIAVSGKGRGQFTVLEGLPQIHKVIHELLKLDIVYQVICEDGYFMIIVSQPHRWHQILGEVQYIIAKFVELSKNDKLRST